MGKVPCVLYGGEKQVYFSATENDLNKLVNTPDVYLLKIDIDGELANKEVFITDCTLQI